MSRRDFSLHDQIRAGHASQMRTTSSRALLNEDDMNMTQSSRDERWLLSAPRPTSKRGNSSVSQTYAELINRNRDRDDFNRRPKPSHSASHSISSMKSSGAYLDEPMPHTRNGSIVREVRQKESPIIAELKTNVIIKDEYTLVTDMSYHIANRYNKPESCVMIKVDHSACLALGGLFDPCYVLSISALPFQLSSTANRRNAAIIQTFMADILSVPADRGIVKFEAIDEGNLAMNGLTMIGETERNEQRLYNNRDSTALAVKRAINHANRRSLSSANNTSPRSDNPNSNREFVGGLKISTKNNLSVEQTSIERKRRSIPEEPEPPSPDRHEPMPNVYELPAAETKSAKEDVEQESDVLISPEVTPDEVADQPNGRVEPSYEVLNDGPRPQGSRSLDEEPRDEELRRKAAARLSQPSFSNLNVARLSASERYSSGLQPEQKSLLSQALPPNINSSPTSQREIDDLLAGSGTMRAHLRRDSKSYTTVMQHLDPDVIDEPYSDPKLDARAAERQPRENSANVAKRRSLITATPHFPMPRRTTEVESKTLSSSEPKGLLSKRKSFLAAFRRNPVLVSR